MCAVKNLCTMFIHLVARIQKIMGPFSRRLECNALVNTWKNDNFVSGYYKRFFLSDLYLSAQAETSEFSKGLFGGKTEIVLCNSWPLMAMHGTKGVRIFSTINWFIYRYSAFDNLMNTIIYVSTTYLLKHRLHKFYIHCSVHHYNCSKIITNNMALLDYLYFRVSRPT